MTPPSLAHCSPPAVWLGSQQATDQYRGLGVGDPCLKEAEWWDVRLARHCWCCQWEGVLNQGGLVVCTSW